MPWARAAVRVIAALTAVVLIVDITVVAVAGQLADRVYVGIAACVAVTSTALALVISRKRPANPVAPLLSWMALLAVVNAFSDTYLPANARRSDVLVDLPDIASAILVVTWVWLYVAVALVILFFPDGRLPAQGWRWAAIGLPVVGVAIQVLMAVTPGPYDAPYAHVAHPFGNLPSGLVIGAKAVLFPALVALSIACVASLGARYRRGDDVCRAQVSGWR